MLLALSAVLALAWIIGFTALGITSGLLHVLVIAAAIVLLRHFVREKTVM